MLASCGGDSRKAVPTRPAGGAPSLIYVTYTRSSTDPSRASSRLYELGSAGEARLIHEYPDDALYYLLASPDGSLIALIDNGIMNIIDRNDGADVMELGVPATSSTAAGPFASWKPDSKLFTYSRINKTGTPISGIANSARSGWIEMADVLAKTIVTPAWTKVVPASNPSWSPRGDEFVAIDYGVVGDKTRALIIGGLDGKKRTLTGDPEGSKAMPVWSPDAKHIAYWVPHAVPTEAGQTVPAGVFVVDEDGKDVRFLAVANYITPQAWSPDGRQLAIACSRESEASPTAAAEVTPSTEQPSLTTNICVVDVDSGGVTRLTTGASEFSPAFSPDGDTIAYLTEGNPGGTFTLKTIRISDREEKTVATGVPLGGMTWAPGTTAESGTTPTP